MKQFIALLVALLLLTFGVNAQSYSSKTLGTFVSTGSAATNVAYVIPCTKQSSVTLSWLRQSSGATAQSIGIAYSRSVDGSKYDSTWEVMALAGGGATETVTTTNIPTWGAGYIKIHYSTNYNAGTVFTTNTLKWAEKIQAP